MTFSFPNDMMKAATRGQPEPEVRMGATVLWYSDREAGTITAVFKVGNTTYVKVQQDTFERIDKNGHSENQSYVFTPDPNGREFVFRRNDKCGGRWDPVDYNSKIKRWVLAKTCVGLMIGKRDKYYDFSF